MKGFPVDQEYSVCNRQMPSALLMAGVSILLGMHLPVRAQGVGCLVEPDRVADVGAQTPGVLDRLMVERGDTVRGGQVLARLSAQVERASVSVAETRAQAEAEYRQALAASELAHSKLERARHLLKQEFISSQALDQAVAEARMAEQRVAQAKEAQRVARKEYQLSTAQLGQKDIRSPFDGIVIERYLTEGEHIERQPVVRVARINPLRIEAIVPVTQYGQIAAGQWVKIKTDLAHLKELTAKVVLVDKVVDPASNSFRVRMSLSNPDNSIPAGLRCRVDFAAKVTPPEASAASARPNSAQPSAQSTPLVQAALGLPKQVPAAMLTHVRAVIPSSRWVVNHQAPERKLVMQYLASKEPRLSMTRQLLPQSVTHLARLGERAQPRARQVDAPDKPRWYSMR